MICKAKLRTCRLDIPEDAHQGGVITSQITLCRNLGEKEGGGRIFEGSVLVGHYGTCIYEVARAMLTHSS